MNKSLKYVAFLRGINVGGHHKLPMADLKKEMASLGFKEVETLLNSGNVIFSAAENTTDDLEEKIASRLSKVFGFAVPVLVRQGEDLLRLASEKPFQEIEISPDTRLYISFLKLHPQEVALPWTSEDQSFQIIKVEDRMVCSVLQLSKGGTVKGMESLERIFGKNITTRNWNTVEKIAERLRA